MQRGKVITISVSNKRGEKKKNVQSAFLLEDRGIQYDAHALGGLRQVSLLMNESIETIRRQGVDVHYGDFAENIVTNGINLKSVQIGDRIFIGKEGELKVTKIGKECTTPCRIFYEVGSCIMPEEGIFCKVAKGGNIAVGDEIRIEKGV